MRAVSPSWRNGFPEYDHRVRSTKYGNVNLVDDVGDLLPVDFPEATLVGRVFDPEVGGPCIVVIRGEMLVDISESYPTMSDLLESKDPVGNARSVGGGRSWSLRTILVNSTSEPSDGVHLLAPIDLSVIKAAGVTFTSSLRERLVEEQAGGDPVKAVKIRDELDGLIGADIGSITPGSTRAAELKAELQSRGMWSPYLEVGLGPDPEVFTKAPVLAAVGCGQQIGISTISSWNNPEPEIALAISSAGRILGATLGNDVNLRDIEGRSALLLPRAKDNNASASVGPFLRLFDEGYTLEEVREAEVRLRVRGEDDGFVLSGVSQMKSIARDPADLVAHALSRDHQYPDGILLYLGTLFAPTDDRDSSGKGFTHHIADVVKISSPKLGALVNRVNYSHLAPDGNLVFVT